MVLLANIEKVANMLQIRNDNYFFITWTLACSLFDILCQSTDNKTVWRFIYRISSAVKEAIIMKFVQLYTNMNSNTHGSFILNIGPLFDTISNENVRLQLIKTLTVRMQDSDSDVRLSPSKIIVKISKSLSSEEMKARVVDMIAGRLSDTLLDLVSFIIPLFSEISKSLANERIRCLTLT